MTATNAVIHSTSCHSVEYKMNAKVMLITELKPFPSTKKKEKRNAYNIKYTG
jgi:transposase